MDRSDVIKLISVRYTVDSIGQRVPTETERSVFCQISSISASEFFEAGKAGLRPQIRATVFGPEYNNEITVEYNGVRYGVYRTYVGKDDTLDLYLEKKAGL